MRRQRKAPTGICHAPVIQKTQAPEKLRLPRQPPQLMPSRHPQRLVRVIQRSVRLLPCVEDGCPQQFCVYAVVREEVGAREEGAEVVEGVLRVAGGPGGFGRAEEGGGGGGEEEPGFADPG